MGCLWGRCCILYNSPCLFLVCTSNGVHFYLSITCWENLILSCVSMTLLKSFNHEIPLPLYMFLSFSLSAALWHWLFGRIHWFDLLCFTSWLADPPAIKSCFTKTLVAMFSLAGSTGGLIFVGLGFDVCATLSSVHLFSVNGENFKSDRLKSIDIEKEQHEQCQHTPPPHFRISGIFQRCKKNILSDIALQYQYFGGNISK